MNDPLLDKLDSLHAANQPDPAFADSLDARLRTAHASRSTSHRETRYAIRAGRILATAAALILIASVLVLTVPPLRALAQDILDFFVPGTMPLPSPGTSAGTVPLQFETVEKAEVVAGFDALQIIDSRVTQANILANTDYVNIFYYVEDAGMLILSQWKEGAGIPYYPVSPDSAVQSVSVNGIPAQFVAGEWIYSGDKLIWQPDNSRQLHWEHDGIVYNLNAPSKFADTAEALVAIAEALE